MSSASPSSFSSSPESSSSCTKSSNALSSRSSDSSEPELDSSKPSTPPPLGAPPRPWEVQRGDRLMSTSSHDSAYVSAQSRNSSPDALDQQPNKKGKEEFKKSKQVKTSSIYPLHQLEREGKLACMPAGSLTSRGSVNTWVEAQRPGHHHMETAPKNCGRHG